MIKKHEGYSDTVYTDSKGVPTIGYGFNLTEPIPKAVSELWLGILIDRHRKELKQFEWFSELSYARKDVLINMHYNLGHSRFLEFEKMIKALEEHDYDKAAKEMLDSQWADDVGIRAIELASIMKSNDNIGI